MLSLLVSIAGIIHAACHPLPGAHDVLLDPHVRYVLVGETPGTLEEPAAFTDLLCYLERRGRPLEIGLQQSTVNQPFLDAFMASDGGEDARAALLKAPMWSDPADDATTSSAYLAMIEEIRDLRAAGGRVALFALNPENRVFSTEAASLADVDADMAKAIAARRRARPEALIIAYVNAPHADRGALGSPGRHVLTMAAALPSGQVLSLRFSSAGGMAWNLQDAVSAPHAAPAGEQRSRSVVLAPEGGFDGVIFVGKTLTPSAPIAALGPPGDRDHPRGDPILSRVDKIVAADLDYFPSIYSPYPHRW